MDVVEFLFTLLVATLLGYSLFFSLFMLILDEYLKSISYSCIAIFSLIVFIALLFL